MFRQARAPPHSCACARDRCCRGRGEQVVGERRGAAGDRGQGRAAWRWSGRRARRGSNGGRAGAWAVPQAASATGSATRERARAAESMPQACPPQASTRFHTHAQALLQLGTSLPPWRGVEFVREFTVSTDGEAAAGRAQVVIQACVAQLSQPPDCSGRCRWVPGNSLSTQGHGQGGGHADSIFHLSSC